ncbi:MAG: response regulator [Candidatus Omnitrophica bacterium]|nr:response regulator [Candidatus Omnitrophota bacterium]
MSAKQTVMIIDDEQDIRENLKFQFSAKGFQVVEAEDGFDGLRQVHEARPDLIILDLNMPNMGGIEFYHKILDAKGHPKYSILILTARANTKQMFQELNIDGFITKPFEIDQVIEEAKTIIGKNTRKQISDKPFIQQQTRGIFFVDHDRKAFREIGMTFLDAGYKVNSAKNGTEAIEKMMIDPPCLALVNLGLEDISGDMVIEKLQYMSKTSKVQFVLYVQRNGMRHQAVLDKMSMKKGVLACVEYSDPQELLYCVDNIFGNGSPGE